MNIREEAADILLDVTEGFCPLCRVHLVQHADLACCPCGGCSYRVKGDSLLMGSCPDHPLKTCEHWQVVWEALDRRTDD